MELRLTDTPLLKERALAIRRAILCPGTTRAPEQEQDALDGEAVQLLAEEDGKPLGCGRYVVLPDGWAKGSRIAVLPDGRGMGVGRAIVEELMRRAKAQGCPGFCLHARRTALGFYQRLGFRETGETFLEDGIPHSRVERRL